MDLNAILVFAKVVEAGSYVGAARLTNVPKSTIARRIEELEGFLGVRLLQRNTRQSQITEEGRAFYARCRQILEDIEDATASVQAQQRRPHGRLRLSASVLMAETFLGPWTIEYMKKYPEVDLDMYLATQRADLVADGFDLAIRVGRLESSSHIVRKLAPISHYICASPSYLEAHGVPQAPEDLRKHDCVIFSPDRVRMPWDLEDGHGNRVSVNVPGRILVNSFVVALEVCLEGLAIAHLPPFLCCDALRSGALLRLMPEWSNPSTWIHALYPSRRHLSATVRTFLDFVAEKLNPPPWLLEAPPD